MTVEYNGVVFFLSSPVISMDHFPVCPHMREGIRISVRGKTLRFQPICICTKSERENGRQNPNVTWQCQNESRGSMHV